MKKLTRTLTMIILFDYLFLSQYLLSGTQLHDCLAWPLRTHKKWNIAVDFRNLEHFPNVAQYSGSFFLNVLYFLLFTIYLYLQVDCL